MDDRTRAEIDQGLAAARETITALWWSMFVGAKEKGFSEQQAIDLVKTYILSQNPNGIRPPNDGGGAPDGPIE